MSLATAVVVLVALLVLRDVWLPFRPARRARLRKFIAGVAIALASAIVTLHEFLASWVAEAAAWLPEEAAVAGMAFSPSAVLAGALPAVVVAAAWLANYATRDRTAMQEHPEPLELGGKKGRSYAEYLKAFCEVLRSDLRQTNLATSWSDAYFTALDAEVEVERDGVSRRKVRDLLTAIRDDRDSRVFLVLGDPGSGKSVALRKLAMEFLDEVERTGRLPVYVNLKEWRPTRPWTREDPPKPRDLYDFIVANLKQRSDLFANEFIDRHFREMLDKGHVFLILDSFDEIPAVLDASESSEIVGQLSELLSTFLAGADQTRGIVASRFHRRPILTAGPLATLEIRPFTEMQIDAALRHSSEFTDATRQTLFRDRQELVPVARNPFSAALLRNYVTANHGALPRGQLELYEGHLHRQLTSARDQLRSRGLTQEQVVEAAMAIAWCIFESPTDGLEAEVADLERALPQHRVRDVAAVLQHARLARLGSGSERFSFVHRRFAEFFAAIGLLREPGRANWEHIPRDGRMRETLVLYCEVADLRHAKEIASACWGEIEAALEGRRTVNDPEFLRTVHCLRFLREAFRARPECIEPFRGRLAEFVLQQARTGDLLSAKLAVEATGILAPSDAEEVIVAALSRENEWLSQTAVRSCRHLSTLAPRTQERLCVFLNRMSTRSFFEQRRELLFSLALSDAFAPVRRHARARQADIVIGVAATVVGIAVSPVVILMGLFLVGLGFPHNVKHSPFSFFKDEVRLFRAIAAVSMLTLAVLVAMPTSWYATEDRDQGNPFAALRVIDPASVHGWTAASMTGALLVFGLAAFIPLQTADAIAMRRMHREVWKNFRAQGLAKVLGYILASLAVFAILGLAFWFAFLLLSHLVGEERLKEFTLLLFPAMLLIFISSSASMLVWRRLRDQRHLARCRRHSPSTRERIAADLAGFASADGRRRYLRWLKRTGITPAGAWPNGRPSFGDDDTTSMLHAMEERWLKLDR